METITVCGFGGSLRKASYNRALLRAAVELAPEGMQVALFDRLGELPLYNPDVEAAGLPEPVAALKAALGAADAILVATPEYNYGIPAPLKNAIDWASRPPTGSPLNRKPALIIGCSPGIGGTIRAQLAVRQAFVFTQTHALPGPEFILPRCADKFDGELRLVDEKTRTFLAERLAALGEYTVRLRGGPESGARNPELSRAHA